MTIIANHFLTLPLDIHTLITCHLSPSDILKLRTISKASYYVFTSPEICARFLTHYGVFPSSMSTARIEFDRHFIPHARSSNGNPTKAIVVDGVKLNGAEVPYFTKSHTFVAIQGEEVGGIRPAAHSGHDDTIIYRTAPGDLALLHLSDPSRSSVLLISESWEFAVWSLADYNKNGGKVIAGGSHDKGKGKLMSRLPLRDKAPAVGSLLQQFDIHIHDDFGGEVALVELSWGCRKLSKGFDVSDIGIDNPWHKVITRDKNLGLVVSLRRETLGHPISAFFLPKTAIPFSEYVLNKYYISGVVYSNHQFAFLRYARDGMETVCSLEHKPPKEGEGRTWSLPIYLASPVLIDLSTMGLPDNDPEDIVGENNASVCVQPDKAGELAFMIASTGVTAFDVSGVSRHSGPTIVTTYWWRQSSQIKIFLPGEENSQPDDDTGAWRQGRWNRQGKPAERPYGKKAISPSIPTIWRTFLPGKLYGCGEGDFEMFKVVRAYNYAVQRGGAKGHSIEVPLWSRAEFLVVWDIPLTKKGIDYFTPNVLNKRLGISEELVCNQSTESEPLQNEQGIFPSKIMELYSGYMDNPTSAQISEPHTALSANKDHVFFIRRSRYETKPGLLAITKREALVQRDEYFETVGPMAQGKYSVESIENGLLDTRRSDSRRNLIRLNWNRKVKCERPYPLPAEKRKSRIVEFLSGADGKIGLDESSASGVERLLTGDVHHIKAGDSGSLLAYVVSPDLAPGAGGSKPAESRKGGSLVVMCYD